MNSIRYVSRFPALGWRNHSKLPCAIFGLFCVLWVSGANAQLNLSFGVYTTDKPTTMVKTCRPLLSGLESDLSKKLKESVNIKLQVASSYQKEFDSLVSGTAINRDSEFFAKPRSHNDKP